MEFDPNLLFNFASIVASLLFLSATGVTIFCGLKLRWPVTVNCWFCNNYTKIYRSELNWWKCPTCEQYNGFTRDGDYAYEIPEQSARYPCSFTKPRSKRCKANKRGGDNLCERCNRNEELKLSELHKFEPNRFFNSGLDNFKKQLEMKYPLCDDCKILVKNVLQKQSLWLTRYKMLVYKQKAVDAINNNAEKLNKTIRIMLTMLTSAMMYCPNYRPLPFMGVLLQLIVFVIHRAHRSSDAILMLLWICIILSGPLNEISLSKLYETNDWPSLEHLVEYHMGTFFTLVIGVVNVTSKYRNNRSFVASFKKLDSPNASKRSLSTFDDGFDDFDLNGDTNESQKYSDYLPSSTNDHRTTLIKKSMQITRKSEDRPIASPKTLRYDAPSDFSSRGSRHVLKFDRNSEQYSLNDSLSTLKTLTLGDARPGQKARVPTIFRTKVYGSTSPDLFNRTYKSTRKFILAPPKLKSFAQTSWVAGGYWQVGVDSPSLSRSSSQSSGFGSAGSNFGPSREPSVTKEIDKCSVISDNTQFCYAPRPNSVNSVNSCCQHGSQMTFSRCDNSSYKQQVNAIPNSMFLQNSQSHFSPVHPESNLCYERCSSLQNGQISSSAIQPSPQLPNCSNAQNNTLWLTILLGGSLVFNIAIFCTIILR